jgi:sarcosine oxidase subunit gamma
VTVRERRTHLVELAARRGRDADMSAWLRAGFGLDSPAPGRMIEAGPLAAIWLAPGTVLVTGPAARVGTITGILPGAIGGAVDQSGGFAVLRLDGGGVTDLLTRFCRLDLDARAFPDGSAARTLMAQTTVLITRPRPGAYDLFVPTTLAHAFAHAILGAASAFGCDVRPPLIDEPEARSP